MATFNQYVDERVVKIAKRLHSKCNLSLPVDVSSLIKERADLHEIDIPFKVDGLCLDLKVVGKRPKVFVRPNGNPQRKRFTLAHEFGHIMIPWHTGNIIDNLDDPDGDVDLAYWIMEKEANVFASELLIPEYFMNDVVNNGGTVLEILSEISDICDVSVLASLYRMIDFLPKNNILCVSYNGGDFRCHRSPGSRVGFFGPSLAELTQDDLPSGERVEFTIGPYSFVHWNFPTTLPLPLETDGREWRAILRECIHAYHIHDDDARTVMHKINAIVSAVNSSLRSSRDEEEMYAQIIHRFSGDEELGFLLDVNLFHQYLVKRIRELIGRRAQSLA